MKKIIITGSAGKIGQVLRKGLGDYPITPFDLPEHDARDKEKLAEAFESHGVAIHLAWDSRIENWKSETISPDNALMIHNAYFAAVAAGVSRVIMASSIHADEFLTWKSPDLLKTDKTPVPTSPYGAMKVFMEALGRYYAREPRSRGYLYQVWGCKS